MKRFDDDQSCDVLFGQRGESERFKQVVGGTIVKGEERVKEEVGGRERIFKVDQCSRRFARLRLRPEFLRSWQISRRTD